MSWYEQTKITKAFPLCPDLYLNVEHEATTRLDYDYDDFVARCKCGWMRRSKHPDYAHGASVVHLIEIKERIENRGLMTL